MSAVCASKQFDEMMKEYANSFEKKPSSAHQLVQFSKDKNYGFKYKELNILLSVWLKQQTQTGTASTTQTQSKPTTKPAKSAENVIDFDSLWDEYQTKYGYSPKKARQFWSFMKEEKAMFIKFKCAQNAFSRIVKERAVPQEVAEGGATSDTETDFILSSDKKNKIVLKLKVDKNTSSEQLEQIKEKFIDLLQCFRATICDDPRSPLHFYNFINDRTRYKVAHGDVQYAYNYALEQEWFEPMRRRYKNNKVYKEQTDEGNADSDEGCVVASDDEFELVADNEKKQKILKKKKKMKKQKKVIHDVMSDEDFDEILKEYALSYDNKPKNAAQIQAFGKEIGRNYKWKAVRIAFARWVEFRGGKMPNKE